MELQPFQQFLERLKGQHSKFNLKVKINGLINDQIRIQLNSVLDKATDIIVNFEEIYLDHLTDPDVLLEYSYQVTQLIKLTANLNRICTNEVELGRLSGVDQELINQALNDISNINHLIYQFNTNIRQIYYSSLTHYRTTVTYMRVIKQYLERGSDLSTLQRTTLLFGKTKF